MKNILMIAYYYPPKGGAGVQRTAKFAKYLAGFGFNVHILTVKDEKSGVIDHSMEKDISSDIKVHRTSIDETDFLEKLTSRLGKSSAPSGISQETGRETRKSRSIKSYIFNAGKKAFLNTYSLLYIPDDKKGWINYAVEEGKSIIQENKIDIIYTTSAPYTSHIIGLKLANEFPVKWVADFRDPWASNPFADYNFIIQTIYNRLENKVVKKADRVVSVSKPIIDDFACRYPDEAGGKFIVIPNGYDDGDFEGLNLNVSEENERFTVLYSGTLYGKRSPEKILSSIETLMNKGLVDRKKIRVKFIGQIGSQYKGLIYNFMAKYPDIIEHRDYIPHKESINELCRANALLLIIDEGKGSEGIYTGKIFEYIRTGKPILGMVPDGVARDLILDTKTGYLAYPSNQAEIEDMLYNAYSNFYNRNQDFCPDWDSISKYSRKSLTKRLIEVIEDIGKEETR